MASNPNFTAPNNCCFDTYSDQSKFAWSVLCCGLITFLIGSILTGVFTDATSTGIFVGIFIFGLVVFALGLLCFFFTYTEVKNKKASLTPLKSVFYCDESTPIPETDPLPYMINAARNPQTQVVIISNTNQVQAQPTYFNQPQYPAPVYN